jgi:hypothetical protein
MKPEESEILSEGVSRRRMLKRIGAGAAIAWTAPVLTSIRTPAFAATPPPDCPPESCPGTPCQTGGCQEGLACFVYGPDTEGRNHCYQDIFCTCVVPCSISSDCGPGQFCQPNTGCGSGGVCLDCCGQGCRAASGGRKPSGKTAKR